MNYPLVSICIPLYNHARFLPSAIESALAQTYDNMEIIIVDDGSADGGLEVARDYEARHPKLVRVFTHIGGVNKGVSATINVGIKHSRGACWCIMGSDDVFQPSKTKRQVEFLQNNLQASFVYSRTSIINAHGDFVEGSLGRDISQHRNPLEQILRWNAIPASTVMVRADSVGMGSLLHDEALLHSDWELWIRLMAYGRVGFIDEPLVLYRVHGENISMTIDPEVNFRECLKVMTSLRSKASQVGGRLRECRVRAVIELQRSFFLFKLGRAAESTIALKAAFDVDETLKQDATCIADWLHGRDSDYTEFVVATLKNSGLISVATLITPRWVYVRSKPVVKSLLGSAASERVARVKRRAQTLLRVNRGEEGEQRLGFSKPRG